MPVWQHYLVALIIFIIILLIVLSARNQAEYQSFAPFLGEARSIEKKEEPIPFTEENQQDANLDSGKTEVRREGENGVRVYTFQVTKKGKKEINRELLANEISKPAVNKLIVTGTRVIQVAAPSQNSSGASSSAPRRSTSTFCTTVGINTICNEF